MAQPPIPARPIVNPEPGNALRALLDLPLRQALDPGSISAIATFASEIRGATSSTDWSPLYARAIQISDELLGTTDRRLEELQRRALTLEDPMEARNRISQAPRREADRARTEAKASIQKVLREWIDRAKRQQEHVASGCAPQFQDLRLVRETTTEHGVMVALDPRWWADFSGYVSQCCDQWTKNFCPGVDHGFGPVIAQGLSEIEKRHGPVELLPSSAFPIVDARFEAQPSSREVDVPSAASMLMRSASRMTMMIGGIVGTGLGAATAGAHGTDAVKYVALGVAVVSFIAFTAITYVGYGEAKHQKAVLRERGVTMWRDTSVAQIRGDLDKVLDRHRRALERWATQRAEQWTAAIDRWWETRVEPRLAESDVSATDQARELKLQQSRLQEEIGNLRSFRSQLAQTVIFELRRRLRELSESAPRSG